MRKVGYKYWDERASRYKILEAGTLNEETKIVTITNANILPVGEHPAESLSWWEVCDTDPGFYLID